MMTSKALVPREPSAELTTLFGHADKLYAVWYRRVDEVVPGESCYWAMHYYLRTLRSVIYQAHLLWQQNALSDHELCHKLRTFIERNAK